MKTINRNNYEAFLLDYIEQNLSTEMVAELLLFLEQNPEYKAELEEFKNVVFSANESATFNQKDSIKKAVVEELMIAEIEGLNTPKASKELFDVIDENPNYIHLFSNYKKTILVPPSIVFADKKSLKQKETKVIPLYWWISSAAAILLVFLLLKNFNNDTVEPLIVENSKLKIESSQSTVHNKHFTVNSLQSTVQNQQTKTNRPKPTVRNNKTNSKLITQHPSLNSQSTNLITQHPTSKEMIEIEAYKEKEYIIIEPTEMVVEESTAKDEFLTVAELLKKEAQKRILANETKNVPTELMAANVVAKVFGKNAEVETKENSNGETEEYALNIGEFSFSRKIRK